MDFIITCTGCYQSTFDCSCKEPEKKHVPLTREQYEKGLNEFYAVSSTSSTSDEERCSLCNCWWCDARAICNPCVNCDEGETCIFDMNKEIEAAAVDDEEKSEESVIFRPDAVDENSHDEDQYYVSVFERRVHDHRTVISLKSRASITIAPESSAYIRTNVTIGEEIRRGQEPSIYRSKLEIDSVPAHWWLSDPARAKLLTKRGYVSPDFTGELHIQVYNRMTTSIIVPAGAPVGSLVISCYEYYSPRTVSV